MIPLRPFYFLRHGEADWNVERRCIGQLDRPLTERGRDQARRAREAMIEMRISVVFHSPLARAADTAMIVGEGRGWRFIAEDGLMEANLGVKQGAREDDPADPFIRDWIGGATIPGAETHAAMNARVVAAVRRCLGTLPADTAPTLLVAHSGVYHAIRDTIGSPAQRVGNCEPWFHEPSEAGWRVTRIPVD